MRIRALEMRIWGACSEPSSDDLGFHVCSLTVNKNVPCRNLVPCLYRLLMHRTRYCWCQIPVVEQTLHETSDRRDKGDSSLPPSFLLNLLQQTGDGKTAGEASREMVQCMQTDTDNLVSPS